MSQAGWAPINRRLLIGVSEHFIKSKGIDIPEEWLELDTAFDPPIKVLKLLKEPEKIKTKHHDIFYEKYFEKYPHER